MLQPSGRRDNKLVRLVIALIVGRHGFPGGSFDGRWVSPNGATQHMVTQDRFHDAFVSNIAGVVIGHGQLFQNDCSFDVKLGCVQNRIRNHVRQHINGHTQVVILHLGVVAGVLFGGHRIVLATNLIKGDGNIKGRALRGTFEEKVFEKVGRTVGDLVFISGANSNPETDGGRESSGYFFSKDANTTGVNRSRNQSVSAGGEF